MLEVRRLTNSFGSRDRSLAAADSVTTIVQLRSVARYQGPTVVVVTHDPSLADQADKVFRFEDGLHQTRSSPDSMASSDGAGVMTNAL